MWISKKKLRFLVFKLYPRLGYLIDGYRIRKQSRDKFFKFQGEISRKLYTDNHIEVLSGPFKGLQYFNENVFGLITNRWIGSYESELHELINKFIAEKKYFRIIDIGSDEGYYAIGLAKAIPKAEVYSYDISSYARKLQARLSKINNIKNVIIRSSCSNKILNKLSQRGVLIICDIEGGEYNLIDPVKSPHILQCDLLIEVHNSNNIPVDKVEIEIKERFRKTHIISKITVQKKDIKKYMEICRNKLSEEDLNMSLDEHRGQEQAWLWIEAI